MKSYQPSNGTEGWFFECKFCDNCTKDKQRHTNDTNDPSCEILLSAMCFDINEPEYPKEWIYNDKNEPTCTAFKYHNWRDPFTGELILPEEIEQTNDPNQLKFF
jgi:hypothetical protein